MSSDYSRCCGSGGGFSGSKPNDKERNASFACEAKSSSELKDSPSPQRRDCPFTYSGKHLHAIDFPLGGFGAGNVNIAEDGSLLHWTILNQTQAYPDWRQNPMPASWFGLQVQSDAKSTASSSALMKTKQNSASKKNTSLPSIDSFTLKGQYPIANLDYHLPKDMPITVKMEAMSPLIPGSDDQNIKDSSLPCAIFAFTLENPTSKPLRARIVMGQHNFVGWNGRDKLGAKMKCWGGNVNSPFHEEGGDDNSQGGEDEDITIISEGLLLSSDNHPSNVLEDPTAGTLCLAAVHSKPSTTPTLVSVIPQASDESDLWQQFVQHQDAPTTRAHPSKPSLNTTTTSCGVVQSVKLAPKAKATVTFILAWHFPNRTLVDSTGAKQVKAWDKILPTRLGNYYSTHWFPDSAQQVVEYVANRLSYLVDTTRLYRDVLYRSSLPPELLECAAGRVSVLRSPTMWYTADGIVMGSEGNGCCPLNCTHVYGYTTLMERLFPTLAQDMRKSDFVRTYDALGHSSAYCGGVPMRYGTGGWAIDGALASVIKTYLVVQQSDPNLVFLKQVWPNVKDQMRRIQKYFDTERDGVIRGLQQNTYDTAMAGANTFIGSYFVTSLKALSCMADLMGETDLAKTSKEHAQLAARNYDAVCWNESYDYYIADVTKNNSHNSYGIGCALDQLCAVGLSSACGFGHVFDPQHEARARQSILKYNQVTKPPFQDQQHHFHDGDKGVCLLSYPNGRNADKKWIYEDLVGSGFTSPFIAGLLLDGKVKAASDVAGNIRQRHDGRTASPWNEPECNTLYARSMAHWNIFDQACGFRYSCHPSETPVDRPTGVAQGGCLSFQPRCSVSDFCCFVILNGGWGEYCQVGTEDSTSNENGVTALSSGTCLLSCLHGSFCLSSLGVHTTASMVNVTLDGIPIQVASFNEGVAVFVKSMTMAQGSRLCLVFQKGEKALAKAENGCTNILDGLQKRKRKMEPFLLWFALALFSYFMHEIHVWAHCSSEKETGEGVVA